MRGKKKPHRSYTIAANNIVFSLVVQQCFKHSGGKKKGAIQPGELFAVNRFVLGLNVQIKMMGKNIVLVNSFS